MSQAVCMVERTYRCYYAETKLWLDYIFRLQSWCGASPGLLFNVYYHNICKKLPNINGSYSTEPRLLII